MCFMWIWEQTAIISLYNINWLVFITQTECVYCAVRTGSLCVCVCIYIYIYIFNVILGLKWLCRTLLSTVDHNLLCTTIYCVPLSAVYHNRLLPSQHAVTLVERLCKPHLRIRHSTKQRLIATCTNIPVPVYMWSLTHIKTHTKEPWLKYASLT